MNEGCTAAVLPGQNIGPTEADMHGMPCWVTDDCPGIGLQPRVLKIQAVLDAIAFVPAVQFLLAGSAGSW